MGASAGRAIGDSVRLARAVRAEILRQHKGHTILMLPWVSGKAHQYRCLECEKSFSVRV